MLRILLKTFRYLLTAAAVLLATAVVLLLVASGIGYRLYRSADMGEPRLDIDTARYRVTRTGDIARCGASTLRRNPAGVWELTTGGDPVTRGAESGALLSELMYYQERAFVDQIRRIVPSERYLRFLRAFIVIFNRDLGRYIPEEYRDEIYASSRWCTHRFDAIGNPYERQVNYHAAHDIGHVMQEYMLVGCSSFATWGGRSADSTLLVGRNFDFYVGDDFARNKLVTFCHPERGIPFASVGWAGMSGVLSGMNAAGLTVTLNAAKGALPTRAATPISLLARTILQYASTIEEACAIADTTRTFVSESLLIASARDRRAAVIEKTPARWALYEGEGEQLRCTNHYQSAAFADDPYNLENIATSDSPYRLQRLGELLDSLAPLTPAGASSPAKRRPKEGLTCPTESCRPTASSSRRITRASSPIAVTAPRCARPSRPGDPLRRSFPNESWPRIPATSEPGLSAVTTATRCSATAKGPAVAVRRRSGSRFHGCRNGRTSNANSNDHDTQRPNPVRIARGDSRIPGGASPRGAPLPRRALALLPGDVPPRRH